MSDVLTSSLAEMADDVLDHHDRAVHHHAEVQRTERKQICRSVAQIQADGGEQQRKRHGEGDDECAAHVAEEEEEDDDDEDDAFGEVMEHRMGGVVQQVAAIEEGNDLNAGGKDVVVQLGDLLVDAFEDSIGVVAFMEQDDAFDSIVVVDELAVLPLDNGWLALFVHSLDAGVGAGRGV